MLMVFLRHLCGNSAGSIVAIKIFLPIWLILTAWNMYNGIYQADYSIWEDILFLLLNFAIPTMHAIFYEYRIRLTLAQ